ncbi:uncharacterized protein LOC143627476 [Bidens hawaiensis]|uniref:uncharacterized protein LOC143627476 n=1 Tax=Bidens hawaiensis TaxID=980011 RepID=UPI0040492748
MTTQNLIVFVSCESNIGFVLTFDADDLKEAMKESPERYTDPFLSDEANGKVNSWTQELNHSNIEDDKLITSLTPSVLCEKETELYKDICVDEERILFDENNHNNNNNTGLTSLESFNDHMNIKDNNDEVIKSSSGASSGSQDVQADLTVNEPINDQDLQNSKLDSEERGTHEEVFGSTVSKELIFKAIDGNGPMISLQPGEEPLPSLKSLLETVDNDQQSFQSPVNKTEPATSSGAPKLQDAGPNNVAVVHHGGEGDSSFAVAGPTLGLVTYSGHIGFSGSTSSRSDSSTTSTQSFAFPILQNEWNSSPIRMAKADRRQLQKRRGCRHGLLCFRF